MMFKRNARQEPSQQEQIRQILDTPDLLPDQKPQGDQQWAQRRRISRDEAERIKRKLIGPWRKNFTLPERMEFLQAYEVIADEEPLPIPTSPTHHAEIAATKRASATPAATTPSKTKDESSSPKRKYTTFFT